MNTNASSSPPHSPLIDDYLKDLGISYEKMLEYINHHQLGNYFIIAAGALYVYDFAVTFVEEIDFAWSARDWWRDAPRIVFLLNRYIPFGLVATSIYLNTAVNDIPPFIATKQACSLMPVILLLSVANFAAIEVLLMLRVYILWERSRRIGILLAVVFVFGVFLAIALIRVNIKYKLPLAKYPSNIIVGCNVAKSPGKAAYVYFLGFTIEFISFSLLISRVWMDSNRSSPLISALIRHGALYYTVVLLAFVLAIISITIEDLNFPVFRANVIVIMCSVSCNYLMIGLRRANGSLVGGVTEVTEDYETWQARRRETADLTTSLANEVMAHTRDTDSSPWDVEMSPRLERRSGIGEG